jgi:glycosyltransferase involved in cell wall biosynthesis
MNISVIIPVYNKEKFLDECLTSVVGQEGVTEIILVDDGSSDKSLDLCCKWAKGSSIIQVLTHGGGRHLGRSATRNLGIKHATGDWLSFLDADDYFLPGRFNDLLEMEELEADAYFVSVLTAYEDEKYRDTFTENITGVKAAPHSNEYLNFLIQNESDRISLIGLTVRKSVIMALGGFDRDLDIGEDTDLIWRLAAEHSILPQPGNRTLSTRRVHGSNTYFDQVLLRKGRFQFYNKWFFEAGKYSLDKMSRRIIFRKAVSYYPLRRFRFGVLEYVAKAMLIIRYYAFIGLQKLRSDRGHRKSI